MCYRLDQKFRMSFLGLALRFALLFSGLALSQAKIPEGYIMQISPNCGSDSVEDAMVAIITDLRAEAVGICEDGKEVIFNNTDGVNLYLPVSYPDQGNSSCVFQKRKDSQVYVIKVYVSWGEPNNPVHAEEEEFFVTCTYDMRGTQGSVSQKVGESLIAPIQIQTHLGDPALSVFTLVMNDVLGDPITNEVALGRIVSLKATTDGTHGEQGIRPVGCDAIGALTGRRYAIIRAGCGDGVVFDQAEGFNSSGLIATSPYFSAFDMAGEPSIQFECNFTLCNKSCEGSSCDNERRRRETSEGGIQDVVWRWKDNGQLVFVDPEKGILDHASADNTTVENTTADPTTETVTSRTDLLLWAAVIGIGIMCVFSLCVSCCVHLSRQKFCRVNFA